MILIVLQNLILEKLNETIFFNILKHLPHSDMKRIVDARDLYIYLIAISIILQLYKHALGILI
jgi:hypothetical protein